MHFTASTVVTVFAAALSVDLAAAQHKPGIPDPWVYVCKEQNFGGECTNDTMVWNTCSGFDSPVIGARSIMTNFWANVYFERECHGESFYAVGDEPTLGEWDNHTPVSWTADW